VATYSDAQYLKFNFFIRHSIVVVVVAAAAAAAVAVAVAVVVMMID